MERNPFKPEMPPTLCWSCRNACGGCNWSRYKVQEPVPGWEAVPTELSGQVCVKGKIHRVPLDSFLVLACPQYIPDKK